jgi:hypothetical protein
VNELAADVNELAARELTRGARTNSRRVSCYSSSLVICCMRRIDAHVMDTRRSPLIKD